jgi:hypothetical protein
MLHKRYGIGTRQHWKSKSEPSRCRANDRADIAKAKADKQKKAAKQERRG